jgi:hypothetical protein
MKLFGSVLGWGLIVAFYLIFFEMLGRVVWVPNLALLMVIVLGLYARRTVSVITALALAALELLLGNSQAFHLLWYPAVALGLNYFFYNVFRGHPLIFRITHLGLVVLDVLLSWLWVHFLLQAHPAWLPLEMIIFLVGSSLMAYALRATGEGFFEDRTNDRVWRSAPTYRMAFSSKPK